MSGIIGLEKAIERLGQFSFDEFSEVRELRFYYDRQQERGYPTLDMILESQRLPWTLHLRFCGVRCLRVEDFGSSVTQIMGLNILDMSDRAWEDVFWEIEDYEHGCIGFYCTSVEILSVTPATK